MTDIIARIDAALRCRQCPKLLPANRVSDDFCSDDCQRQWHAARAEPIPARFNGFAMPDMAFPQQVPKDLPVWHREPVAVDPEQVLPAPEEHRSLTYDFLVAVGFHAIVAATAISHYIERITAQLQRARHDRSERQGRMTPWL